MSADRILFFLTSHDDLAGRRGTGYYVDEAAHPWQVLTAAGHLVDLASVTGGIPPQDGYRADDPDQRRFLDDPHIAAQLADTATVTAYDPADYAAVVYIGGHGTVFDFPGNKPMADFSAAVHENGGVIAAVCHGPAGLLDITLPDGSPLIAGKHLTSFTNTEEAAVDLTDAVPFLLESALTARGAIHHAAPDFTEHVVVDDRLITGQNPASATRLGEAVVEALTRR